MKRYTKGFTLIELLVVIAIIGILASVVLVSLQSARKKGNDTRVISAVNQIRTALETEAVSSGYPSLTSAPAATRASFNPSVNNPTAGTPGANIATLIADIISQQSSGGLSGTVAYGAGAGGTFWGANSSVIITKDAFSPGTGYAIYAKLPSTGQAFCIDGNGNTKTTTYPAAAPGSDATAVACQ